MIQEIMDRMRAILFRPEETWSTIQTESTTTGDLYREYLIFVAAIPSLAGFIGGLFAGAGFFRAFFWGVFYYGLSLAGVWVASQLVIYLARNFQIAHSEEVLFRLVAYSATAFWLAGIFFLIPWLYWLSIVGLYGFYLIYIGLARLIDIPAQERFSFITLVVLIIAFLQILPFAMAGALSGIDVPYLKM